LEARGDTTTKGREAMVRGNLSGGFIVSLKSLCLDLSDD